MDNISPLLPGGPLCGFLSGNLKSEPQTQALINLRRSREIFLSIRPSSTLSGASQVALVIKTPPANTGDTRDTDSIPGEEDSLEEGMATHPSILAWRISMDKGGYSPWGCKESHTHYIMVT